VSFNQAIQTCFKKYAVFKGTASRSEYWWWALFSFVIQLASSGVLGRAGGNVVSLAIILPGLAVGVRRMHDSNHSGWWVLCPIVNIVFLFFPSVLTGNRYRTDASSVPVTTYQVTADTATPSQYCAKCGKLRLPGQNFCQGCGTAF